MKKRDSILFAAWCVFRLGALAPTIHAAETADAEADGFSLIPLAAYEFLSAGEQSLDSGSIGLIAMSPNLMIVGMYSLHSYREAALFDYPAEFHTVDALADGKVGRHAYLGLFKSESDRPVAGGLATFQAAAVYGYAFLRGQNLTLTAGGGLALGDFGLTLPSGDPWPLIPVPYIRLDYRSRFIDSSFSFLTGPNLEVTIGPESKLRLKGDFRFDQMRDIRDLIFDCALQYRFFGPGHEMGDFAGVSAGFKNGMYGYVPADREGTHDLAYRSVFGTLDLTLISITGGYAFDMKETCRGEGDRSLGDGFFVSLQGMYQF